MTSCAFRNRTIARTGVLLTTQIEALQEVARKLLRALLVAGIFGVAALMASGPVVAFTVEKVVFAFVPLPGEANHEEITRTALTSGANGTQVQGMVSGAPVTFSDKAISEIEAADRNTDTEFMDDSEVHFDRDTFTAGNTRLINLRKEIVVLSRLAARGSYPQGFAGLRTTLGQALHSVQDFYAHSTWVERGESGLAPLGKADTYGFQSDVEIGETCNLFGLISYSTPLTSGYFSKTQVTDNIDWKYTWEPPSGPDVNKCKHGSSTSAPGVFAGAGLNKDSSVRENYINARFLALRATVQYVNDILGDLQGNDNAIYGLMDVAPPLPPFVVNTLGNGQFCTFNGSGANRSISCSGPEIGRIRGFFGPDRQNGMVSVAIDVPTGGAYALTELELPIYNENGLAGRTNRGVIVSVISDTGGTPSQLQRDKWISLTAANLKNIQDFFIDPSFPTLSWTWNTSTTPISISNGGRFWIRVQADDPATADTYLWPFSTIVLNGALSNQSGITTFQVQTYSSANLPAFRVVMTPL